MATVEEVKKAINELSDEDRSRVISWVKGWETDASEEQIVKETEERYGITMDFPASK